MSRWNDKYVIGLTGNIAVGKSVVRQMLQHLGAYTVDADGLSHQAMAPGAPAYKPIVETFGQFILKPDKTIDRTALARMVFNNPEALSKLEAITHPIIRRAIDTLVKRAKQPIVVIEAIKLLEGDLKGSVDAVWVVNASAKAQYVRLVGKRKMSEEDAKQRILSQNRQDEKLRAATLVIQNDGNIEETWKQVQAAWNMIPVVAARRQQEAEKPKAASKPAAPAQPKPAAPATQVAPAEEETGGPITVKRGMPSNAETIANFISTATGEDLSRTDVIMSFGQKSYLLAEDEADETVAIAGWQVENLITQVDEMHLKNGAPKSSVIAALVRAIEDASKELQSEVSFIFLPGSAGNDMVQPFLNSGYELTTIKEIKIPAWREAVQNTIADAEGTQILTKKLRKDRVLKPI